MHRLRCLRRYSKFDASTGEPTHDKDGQALEGKVGTCLRLVDGLAVSASWLLIKPPCCPVEALHQTLLSCKCLLWPLLDTGPNPARVCCIVCTACTPQALDKARKDLEKARKCPSPL